MAVFPLADIEVKVGLAVVELGAILTSPPERALLIQVLAVVGPG